MLKAYDEYGQCAKPTTRIMKEFGRLTKGDVFKQGGRVLMKIETIYVPCCAHGCEKPFFEERNAIRLVADNDHQGELSHFKYDTTVEFLPEAALYTKG
jgi:hypothetical protein